MGLRIKDLAAGGGNPGAGGVPQGQRRQAPPAHNQPPPGDDEEIPEGLDLKRLYNENRKLSRLLAKSQTDFTELRGQFEPTKRQLDALRAAFGGKPDPVEEGQRAPSIRDQVRRAHERMLESDPEGPGMPLTLGMAEQAHDAYERTTSHEAKIAELEAELKALKNPMAAAEGAMYVSLDTTLEDLLLELYDGEQALVDENKDSFVQKVISKLPELKKDSVKWRRLVTSPKVQRDFLTEVITARLPRSFSKRGAQPIDEYSKDSALADMERAMKMPKSPERAELLKRARQRLIPEMLGFDMSPGR